ncbi:MAG TPA: helix-turn-helix domain-containing protein, partial [Candidatus Dormibacteraeota bacterium]|nr:helix-turn-helix domain-containing protein [Candidatus Dormibacteraeota bacterium]
MLSTREVAERLGVSEASVRRWSDDGRLPVQRVGKRRERRFRLSDVELAARGEQTQPPRPSRPGPGEVVVAGQALRVPFHVPAFY